MNNPSSNSERNTMQKSIILQTVRDMYNHPTADMVYEKVHDNYPTISKATVYRVLNQLSAKGDILKIPVPSGADCYDHRIDAHYHIRCKECGAVADVVMSVIKQVQEPEKYIKDSCGYRITGSSLIFEGLCPECLVAESGK